MSVALKLAPTVAIPERARPDAVREPAQLAGVTALRPPRDLPVAAPLRLTRRGVVAVALAVAALGLGLVWLGRVSAPRPASPPPAPQAVTVAPGDTLWSIAARLAPQRDPRAEVAAFVQRNHLAGVSLVPGQVLQVP
jgi:Tfp pilus assembly protein FimV